MKTNAFLSEYDKKERITVIEAGTGTGKSLAYLLSVIPYALAKKKHVIISTATVALQEQLIGKDLPFFANASGLEFKYDLAKGRGRYVCAQKLAHAVDENAQTDLLLAEPLSSMEQKCLQQLAKAYREGQWQGDRDTWADTIPDAVWQLICSDKHACQRHLQGHAHCPFHKARNVLGQMDVIVANHSLLLADLELGGGKILPEPADSIYVLDEAHHLPSLTRDFSSSASTVKGTIEWFEKLAKFNGKLGKTLVTDRAVGQKFTLADMCAESIDGLKKVRDFLDGAGFQFNDEDTFRFSHGELPESLALTAKDLGESTQKALAALNKMHDALVQDVNDGDITAFLAEPILAESGQYIQRLESVHKLWANLAIERALSPHARWIKRLEYKEHHDYLLSDCPIDVGYYLREGLFMECAGAVLCSATLTALGSFEHFAKEVGLNKVAGTKYIKVDSPFDYPKQAELLLPKTDFEPNAKEFSDYLGKALPRFLDKDKAHLVLFASYWQMRHVAEILRTKGYSLLVQGEASRDALIRLHKSKIDGGTGSILLGTQSLSEGLDLPGNYLEQVIITKLAFAVPTSPIEEAHAEFIESRGGNAFLSITVPSAAKKLVQSCGRLLRKEQDSGRIVILDRRLVSKRYGKAMLDALPPFKRTIEY